MDPDHLRTQRKGAIIPSGLLATYTHSQQAGKKQFGESSDTFEEELEEWLELQEDIPEVLQDSVSAILGRRPLPGPVVASKANDFFAQSYYHLENINRDILSGIDPEPNQEDLLGIYCKLFFILVVEYGSDLAARKLIDMWGMLEQKSRVWFEAAALIRFMVDDHVYPLSCATAYPSKEDVSRYLRTKSLDYLKQTVKASKLSQLNL